MMGTYMTSCGGAAELRWADVAPVTVPSPVLLLLVLFLWHVEVMYV